MSKYYENLTSLLEASAEKFGEKTAFSVVNGISYSYSEMLHLTMKVAGKLYGCGVEKDDKVAIIGENSPHWVAAYFAVHRCGAIVVPILTDFSGPEMATILEHSGSRVLFISQSQRSKLSGIIPPSVKTIFSIEKLDIQEEVKNDANETIDPPSLEKISDLPASKDFNYPEVSRDDLAVIIYTSGTTGKSKGVMLTHDNLIFDATQTGTIHKVVPEDILLSVLPLAHTFESTIGMIIPVLNGASVVYTDRPPTASYLAGVLKDVRPTTMLTVPMIMEKIYRNRIRPGIEGKSLTRTLSRSAITRKLVHRMAGKKLMAFFGGRMRFFGIGGAPLAPDVEKFLIEAKFPYAIGYGLTETAPMLSGFNPSNAVYRSAGKAMEGVELRISNPDPATGEGEIEAWGRNVMKGYYLNEEATASVFTPDGYFKTGDLGLINEKGVLYIKGRSKNMILGSNGENIYPEEIESVINEQEYVNESLVMQSNGKLIAKVHLNLELLEEKFRIALENAHDRQVEMQEKVDEFLLEIRDRVNERISKNSRLQLVVLQTVPFEKTPTLKIKRFLYND